MIRSARLAARSLAARLGARMPKLIHEALVQLIRAAPEALIRLLPPSLGLDGPVCALAQVTADEVVDLHLAEYRADVVVVVGDPERPSAVILTEMQTDFDARKRYRWPVQAGGLWARHRCPVALVVLALDDRVAAAYRQPVDLGWGLITLTPIVLGAESFPWITDHAEARACPELAVLSAMAHGRRPGAEHVALAAITACADLDNERQIFYPDFIIARLGAVARAALEHLMSTSTDRNPFISDFFRKRFDDAWAESEARGLASGLARGEAKGKAEGEAKILLKMIRLKGFVLTPELEDRVRRCTEPAQLEGWADRLLEARTLDEVFAPFERVTAR